MTTTPDIQQLTELIRQSSDPIKVAEHLLLIAGSDGSQKIVDLRAHTTDPRSAKTANRSVRDTRSFLTYLEKHRSEEQTEVYADLEASRIVAIIDAHFGNEEEAGLNQHVLALDLVHTPEWKTWVESDGKKMSQADFAEFMQENAEDVVGDDAVTLLEVAQHLQGHTSVEFESGQRLTNGEVKLAYKETTTARMGQRDDVSIPSEFKIGVKPYLGSARYRVGVQFRYKIGTDGKVTMSYHLDRPHVTLQAAFDDMVNEVQSGLPALTIKLEPEDDGARIELPELPGVQPVLFGKPGRGF